MAYSGLLDFIEALEQEDELIRIGELVDPVLEITEITDRVTKAGGKALLFENSGTDFPVLINTFGSDSRMSMALGRKNADDPGKEIETIFNTISGNSGSLSAKIANLPQLMRLVNYMPSKTIGKGKCQQVIHTNPDLGILPILKCWPFDGGRFITLPLVHTIHPETGKTNVGMYRMQVLNSNTTAMHWQRHKTGANHFEAWKKTGSRMPVSVALGGDPVYTYSATAPLPENINEYILAGFLRKKKVKLVKCITNDLYVPYDADIIIEGYVDTSEDLVWEGPFGDHTGFYSLADWYPRFHVTCITHCIKAVYPATIVGVPPQEDAWLAKITERIFLAPVKLTMQPEIEDFHMPDAGIAHNLVIVKIRKSYPGQGMKVISSLFGAGQMMFTKFLVVLSGDTDIRNYREVMSEIFTNTDFSRDILFCSGPVDVLDHSSDAFSFGGKAGIDATVKHAEEIAGRENSLKLEQINSESVEKKFNEKGIPGGGQFSLFPDGMPLMIACVNRSENPEIIVELSQFIGSADPEGIIKLIVAVDHTVEITDHHMIAWQVLGNTDPRRDHSFTSSGSLIIDGTIKAFRKGGFPRKWPNVVCSSPETISRIDEKWETLNLGTFIQSPSKKYRLLLRKGSDEVVIN
jgi:4-hydroxy-3-polyprenylbenzoate decarboxylase